MNRLIVALIFSCVAMIPHPSAAQSSDYRFDAGAHVSGVASSEFDGTEFGFGGRFAWLATTLMGVEAEMSFYPEDLGRRPFSSGRTEGLFGVTLGPSFSRVRPFAKVRPGFVTFQESPEPFPCIRIFPPPLSCELAAGKTVFALDLGGGVDVFPVSRMFLRFDAGDRMVRYPGPTFDSDRNIHDEAFFSHDFRFSIGAGVRF